MNRLPTIIVILLTLCQALVGQSGRTTGYLESSTTRLPKPASAASSKSKPETGRADGEVLHVATDLVTIPIRIATRDGKPVKNVLKKEFAVFENGVEQPLAYFSNDEQPFTVALVLDMSYSSVFKLDDIRTAARIFILKLRPFDRVTVISFDEKAQVLCEPTNDRRVLQLAIEGARLGSGTALYDALDSVVAGKLSEVPGRRAIVLLTDGVDTSSAKSDASAIQRRYSDDDTIVYTLQYNTFEDVRKNREKNSEVRFDENDRPYVVQRAPEKGERALDYQKADTFLKTVSEQTGGRVYRVSSTTNLNDAFSDIAGELRKIYSIGYYPKEDRTPGTVYDIKVRVYRPNLKVTARNQYLGKRHGYRERRSDKRLFALSSLV
jgi:Ca-activated chloride channel homolog